MKLNKGLIIGLTVVLAAILVAAAQFGIITTDPTGQAALTGGVGVLFIVARSILTRVSAVGWGWKSMTAGVALLIVAGAEVLGLKLPSIIVTVLMGWGSFGLGDAVGLLKPVPK
jgi:hypothetical protein